MSKTRCGGCSMPSTSGPLYVSGRRVLCGMCLWHENADLRERIRRVLAALSPVSRKKRAGRRSKGAK